MILSTDLWRQLKEGRSRLIRGEVIAVPTETVYGLAGRIDSEKALRSIFAIKERPFFDPLIVHVARMEQVKELVREWSELERHLARQFWPGPLTLVMAKSEQVHPLITSGLETVAVRMPAHPIARRLIGTVGVPLAAPSANKFGKTSPTTASHVQNEFASQVYVINGGPCPGGVESTVIRVFDQRIEVLRPGLITVEMLEQAVASWPEKITVTSALSAASPGHLEHHYQPDVPLVIVEGAWRTELAEQVRQHFALEDSAKLEELHLDSDPALAARELYAKLRSLAKTNSAIWVKRLPSQQGRQWTAIWDRLTRASHWQIP